MDLKKIQSSLYLINSFLIKKNKNILDPMSCIITLSLLSVYEDNCKLTIKENFVDIQRPFIYQGFLRWYSNDKRNDICLLCHPIEKALEWYDIEEYKLKYILNECLNGLKKLKKCYMEHSLGDISIIHSILYYESIILKKINNEDISNLDNKNNQADKFKIFKDLWDTNDIICITMFLKKSKDNLDSEYYIDAIKSLLKGKSRLKDELINKIIDL